MKLFFYVKMAKRPLFGSRHGDNAWGSSNSPSIKISFSSLLVDFHKELVEQRLLLLQM